MDRRQALGVLAGLATTPAFAQGPMSKVTAYAFSFPSLEGATIRGASILDSTLTAQMVARNVAIEAMTDARAPIIGIAKGTEHNGGRTWNWTRETRPTGDSRIVRIDVEVMDAAGSRHGHLTVVRTGTVGGAAS